MTGNIGKQTVLYLYKEPPKAGEKPVSGWTRTIYCRKTKETLEKITFKRYDKAIAIGMRNNLDQRTGKHVYKFTADLGFKMAIMKEGGFKEINEYVISHLHQKNVETLSKN